MSDRSEVDRFDEALPQRMDELARVTTSPTESTVKAYALTVYDDSGKLVAAEFVEGLTIGVLDSAERWTDQGGEFRIRRVMERADAK